MCAGANGHLMHINLEALDAHVSAGLLKVNTREHLRIYNYTERCVYDAVWDDITKMARGLIVDGSTGEVIALPFPKFFNHGEHGIDVPIPDAPPDAVTVKLDGSLGISYRLGGRLCWSTRGTFDSPQAEAAQDIWDARYAHVDVPDDWTLLAEIIHPTSRNVVDYGDQQEIIVLGIRNRVTGEDLPHLEVSKWCGTVGLHCVERVDIDYHRAAELAQTLDDQHEGFVVRWGDYRVKVKSRQYLAVARLLQGLTERRIADLWYAGIKADDLPALPEESRDAVRFAHEELDAQASTTAARVDAVSAAHADKPMKDVAAAIAEEPTRGLVFATLRGQRVDVRLHVYKSRHGADPRPTGLNEWGGFSTPDDNKGAA